MKIAMVSEHASPLAALGGADAGGQNVHVAALSMALAEIGHQVTVYTRRDDPELPQRKRLTRGVIVEHVPAGPPHQLPKDELLPYMGEFGRYLSERWAKERPDVVHAHFWMSGLAALCGARDLGIGVVQTFHALGSVKKRHQGSKDTSPPQRVRLEAAIGRSVRKILATSTEEVFELVRLGVPRESIRVVPCGVNVELFTPDGPAAHNAWRTGQRYRLLSLCRLVERKGVDTTIQALSLVPDAELVVAGGPPAEELSLDAEVNRLQHVAKEAHVEDRVTFLGRVSRQQAARLLRAAHVAVCVPVYEPFGMVPLEAMASGTPVVASAVGGMRDTVVDGTTGVLVRPRRPGLLGRALRQLLADETRLSAYAIAGVDRARSRYNWQRVAAETVDGYRRAAEAQVEPQVSGVGGGLS